MIETAVYVVLGTLAAAYLLAIVAGLSPSGPGGRSGWSAWAPSAFCS